jgi:hypothetical protein
VSRPLLKSGLLTAGRSGRRFVLTGKSGTGVAQVGRYNHFLDFACRRMGMWLLLALACVSAAQEEGGFLLGAYPEDGASVVRALGYETRVTPSAEVVLNASSANVTGAWVDSDSQTLFVSTRNAEGGGNILRVGYGWPSVRAIYWYGGSVAGVIWGLTGAHVLRSPSVFWVWQPTGSLSPPYNFMPALYRMPLLGGLPEIVTLHASLCAQMSIVQTSLYCAANGTMLGFDLTRPNSAFVPLVLPQAVASETVQGFIVSRERVLFVLSASGLLHRVEGSAAQSILWPAAMLSQSSRELFAPSLYDEPTDRVAMTGRNETLLFWIGMESFWRDAVAGNASNALPVPPPFRTGLRVFAFSGANVAAWGFGLLMLGLAVAC